MIYTGQRWALIGGDCRERLSRFAEHRFDAVVTDPPYELGFMGKAWDSSGVAFQPETWAAVLRVLKPGGHLVAFGGSRTFHRIAVAIEDAGFEVRDDISRFYSTEEAFLELWASLGREQQKLLLAAFPADMMLSWLYGSGFPKSLDVAKAIDKTGGIGAAEFKASLAEAVTRSGMTRAEVDLACGFTMRFDTPYEKDPGNWGSSLPSPRKWLKIAAVLGLDAARWAGLIDSVWRGRAGEAIGDDTLRAFGQRYVRTEKGAAITDAARQWEGWGTALKPGWEPIILARKPLDGTVAENVQRWGTGALNVDGCRIGDEQTVTRRNGNSGGNGAYGRDERVFERLNPPGRWPPNVCLDAEAAALLDAQAGPRSSGAMKTGTYAGRKSAVYSPDAGRPLAEAIQASTGGASRFFYCSKASRAERDAGCESLPERSGGQATDREDDSAGLSSPRAGAGRRGGARNHHPTVKPIALMRWLVRLVTPPGGAVLDPFTGSGSTGVAALEEGFQFCGVEREAEYLEIARCRVERAAEGRSAA